MRLPTTLLLIALILPLLMLAGCHQSPSPDTDRLLEVVEEMRIGSRDGPRETLFGAVRFVAPGADGTTVIVDVQANIVRIFDRDGNFLRNVGREGSGPGEYLSIVGMDTFPDGRLAVWDPRNQRVHIYSPEGDFLKNVSVQAGLYGTDIFRAGTNDQLYVKTVLRNTPDMPNWKFAWLEVTPDGAINDTIRVPLDTVDREQSYVVFTASGSANPFFDRPLDTLSPDGYLITGRHGDYTLQLNRRDGEPGIISRNLPAAAVQPDERRQWEGWTQHYGTRSPIPGQKPLIRHIFTDSDGRIWVKRYVDAVYTEMNIGPSFGPESRWWEPPTFDIFLPDGSYHATVVLPMNAAFRSAQGSHIWAVERGEYGEQYVVRYRMSDPDAG